MAKPLGEYTIPAVAGPERDGPAQVGPLQEGPVQDGLAQVGIAQVDIPQVSTHAFSTVPDDLSHFFRREVSHALTIPPAIKTDWVCKNNMRYSAVRGVGGVAMGCLA